MSVAQQAKSGFKTFVLTFFVSLLVFGAIYYLISDSVGSDIDIEGTDAIGYTKTQEDEVLGEQDEPKTESPFGELVEQEVDVPQKRVLAGAAESTQSTVPDTGIASVTVGFLGSLVLFAFFAYVVFINPRKYALSKFEQEISRNH